MGKKVEATQSTPLAKKLTRLMHWSQGAIDEFHSGFLDITLKTEDNGGRQNETGNRVRPGKIMPEYFREMNIFWLLKTMCIILVK